MLAAITWMWIAILVAIVWKMVYGSIVNMRPVMGDRWGRWVGLDMANIRREDAMKAMPWAVVWSIVGVVLFDVVWSWTGGSGALDGLMVGLVVGLGAAATAVMVHPPFEQRPMALMWYYGIYHTIEWTVLGLIFGLIGR